MWENRITYHVSSGVMLPHNNDRLFSAQFLCHQLCVGEDPMTGKIIHQQEDCFERCWLYAWIWGNCICTMLLLVCHWEAPMYPHHSLADVQWLVGAKPNSQQTVLSYIVNLRLFQRCSHAHQSRHILQNITKIYLIYAVLFIFMKHGIESTVYVFGWHRMSWLWMPFIAHSQTTTQNVMEVPFLHG